LWPVVLRMARAIQRFVESPPSAASLFQFETALASLLWEMGRRIVEHTLNRVEPAEASGMPSGLYWEGDWYRRKRRSPTRNLNCLFGRIRLWRWLYESPDELRLSALFPLERMLGIVAGLATPALADAVARLTVELTQRQVLEVLRTQYHVTWGRRRCARWWRRWRRE